MHLLLKSNEMVYRNKSDGISCDITDEARITLLRKSWTNSILARYLAFAKFYESDEID